jgi:hypothetical protein
VVGLGAFDFFDALRREAGVILGELSSSELDGSPRALLVGVLGRVCERACLPTGFVVRGRARECNGCFTALKAPGFGTLRWKLTVVMRVDLIDVRLFRRSLARARREVVTGVDLFRARVSRDAIWRECSAASLSARSRATSDSTLVFFVLAAVDLPVDVLRFLGNDGLSDFAVTDPMIF